jgi:hypothetical protein
LYTLLQRREQAAAEPLYPPRAAALGWKEATRFRLCEVQRLPIGHTEKDNLRELWGATSLRILTMHPERSQDRKTEAAKELPLSRLPTPFVL